MSLLQEQAVKVNKKRMFEMLVLKYLSSIKIGYVILMDGELKHHFGDESSDLRAVVIIKSNTFYRKVALEGSVGFAYCYIHNMIEVSELLSLFRIFVINREIIDKADSGVARLVSKIMDAIAYCFFQKNTKKQAKSNILQHYDLGNEFFSLFLDKHMMYSSAMFNKDSISLEQASEYKIACTIEKLNLKPEHHLLEIGSGWGAIAIQAALKTGCRVTTATISDAQYQYVYNKVHELNLEDQVKVINCDYRDLAGTFDRLVSIEMIEAVGHQFYQVYFNKCHSLLKEDGLFLLQAILIRDNQYCRAKTEVDFIKKYVFPGSCIPSVSEIMSCVAKSDMVLKEAFDFSEDYAMTLMEWKKRFDTNFSEIESLGFDDKFKRTWHYYLMYCAAGFIENAIMVKQMTFSKPRYKEYKKGVFNDKYS